MAEHTPADADDQPEAGSASRQELAPAHPEPRVDARQSPPPSDYFVAGILATGMAAVVAAIGTSFLGVQGTVIGALVGAMVGSIVSELTKRELSRLERRARARLLMARRRGLPPRHELTSSFDRAVALLRQRLTRRLILTVGGIAVGGLVVGLTAVSAIELIAGRPLSGIGSSQPQSGTTVGQLVSEAQSAAPTSTAPIARAVPGAPAPASTASAGPSPQPGRVASPSPSETAQPVAPNPRPATSPAPIPAASPSTVIDQQPASSPLPAQAPGQTPAEAPAQAPPSPAPPQTPPSSPSLPPTPAAQPEPTGMPAPVAANPDESRRRT